MHGSERHTADDGGQGDSHARVVELTEQFIEGVNQRLRRLERQMYWRWLLTVGTLVAAGFFFTHAQHTASTAIRGANHAIHDVQAGRRTGTAITCAVLSAVSEAGRATITAPQVPETPFARFLERHGYPPPAVRAGQNAALGRAYVKAISQRVEHLLGHRGDGLIQKDGTIDCAQLQRLQLVKPGVSPRQPPPSKTGH